jgi:hypothetical protein
MIRIPLETGLEFGLVSFLDYKTSFLAQILPERISLAPSI